ncbi:hypothetical protein F5890DRAFT_1558270 [Lentinula detonsa]|uniref:Uncharacterized protein n=1 Tax=Lentinula detonsa TaxID=2804962 RepID=A0AA38PQG3_9AGAR|nr:hypothetical protein F5890DRAFT_1558270 [Lentinula detonsa]
MVLRGGAVGGIDNAFEEGLVYENILVFHPGAPSNIRASFEHSGTFYTHVSPFACILAAFRMLKHWSTQLDQPHRGYEHPPASAHGQQSDRSHLLALTLPAIYPSPQAEEAIRATVQKVDQVYNAILALLELLNDQRGTSWIRSGGSRHDGDDPGPSMRSKTGAASASPPVFNARLLGKAIERAGFTGPFSHNGQQLTHNLWASDPEEGMSIFLHPISVASIWSADCLATGRELATDPAASSAAQGPTKSQQIVSQWHQAQSQLPVMPMANTFDSNTSPTHAQLHDPVPSLISFQTASSHSTTLPSIKNPGTILNPDRVISWKGGATQIDTLDGLTSVIALVS